MANAKRETVGFTLIPKNRRAKRWQTPGGGFVVGCKDNSQAVQICPVQSHIAFTTIDRDDYAFSVQVSFKNE